jgi:hypothetical protein
MSSVILDPRAHVNQAFITIVGLLVQPDEGVILGVIYQKSPHDDRRGSGRVLELAFECFGTIQ